jgi:hypothetical protein
VTPSPAILRAGDGIDLPTHVLDVDGVWSFFLEMDLHASASPEARSVQRKVIPNSPRSSSAPSSYRSAMFRLVGSRSTTSLDALAGVEPLYSFEKGFGSLGFLPPPASAALFGVPQQLPIPSRRGDLWGEKDLGRESGRGTNTACAFGVRVVGNRRQQARQGVKSRGGNSV